MADDWDQWDGGLELARGWPSPSRGIDVDRGELRRIARDMTMEVDTDIPFSVGSLSIYARDVKGLQWQDGHEAVTIPLSHAFGDTAGTYPDIHLVPLPGNWIPVVQVCRALEAIGKAVPIRAGQFFGGFLGVAALIQTTAANYDAAEEALHDRWRLLSWAIRDASVTGGVIDEKDTFVREGDESDDDVSSLDYQRIKQFFEMLDPEPLLFGAEVYRDIAHQFAGAVGLIESLKGRVAAAWPGETSELCLEALRCLHGSAKQIAYVAGGTSEALDHFQSAIPRYKQTFESETDYAHESIGGWRPNSVTTRMPWQVTPCEMSGQETSCERDFYDWELKDLYRGLPSDLQVRLPRIQMLAIDDDGKPTVDQLRKDLYGWDYGSLLYELSQKVPDVSDPDGADLLWLAEYDDKEPGTAPGVTEQDEREAVADARRDLDQSKRETNESVEEALAGQKR
ncbi:hypothetical protein [Nonomuraea basaltis]|uniref:hypothetical protein n=1 Tax=Nonomuraea basaltis TaxID=2495887 RepID=UPI00110C3FFD|nr:hypothetical protein [Nonomuraea basaltis]TMR91701.1 hypothetical protein EJK15_48625 [Nonomuraea basaltis]